MNYTDEEERTIRPGIKLISYGNECVIQEVAMSNGSLYARLSYSVVNGHKTGTDGWYSVSRLLRDDNVIFVDSVKSEEYDNIYRDLSGILNTLGSMRESSLSESDGSENVLLSDEELGRKIREFCTVFGNGGTISCEGLARIILTSNRTYSFAENNSFASMEMGDVTGFAVEENNLTDSLIEEIEKTETKAHKASYITPEGFADCIDSVFSNCYGYMADDYGVEREREKITVDMMVQWLKNHGSSVAKRFGFLGFEG